MLYLKSESNLSIEPGRFAFYYAMFYLLLTSIFQDKYYLEVDSKRSMHVKISSTESINSDI